MNMFSSPISWAISMFAPSMVPMMRPPFMANFMLLCHTNTKATSRVVSKGCGNNDVRGCAPGA